MNERFHCRRRKHAAPKLHSYDAWSKAKDNVVGAQVSCFGVVRITNPNVLR